MRTTILIAVSLVAFVFLSACPDREENSDSPPEPKPTPQLVPIGEKATAIAVARFQNCALLEDRSLSCWGVIDNSAAYWPRDVGLSNVMAVSSGLGTIALSDQNLLYSISPSSPVLTIEFGVSPTLPTLPSPPGGMCVIISGRPWCQEHLGDLTMEAELEITQATQVVGGIQIPDGPTRSKISGRVILLANGLVHCSDVGRCGGSYGERETHSNTLLNTPPRAIAVSLGCLIGEDHLVYCWGSNSYGQLGTGQFQAFDGEWRPVKNIGNAMKVVSNTETSCAIDTEAGLWCWSRNDSGQVGIGNFDRKVFEPHRVLSGVEDVGLGFYHACALKTSGEVYCWGSPAMLGNGDAAERYTGH